jgi:hypothetical protein
VKVALAWNSKISTFFGIPLTSALDLDLDLKIYDSDGVQVGYSGSFDNSYEIAEFIGKPGNIYDIRIRRWSGTRNTWFGIAWTVTDGLPLINLDWFSTSRRLSTSLSMYRRQT